MTLSSSELTERLEFSVDMARQASDLILPYYHASDLHVDLKADRTPVTEADRGAEELMRSIIGKTYPDDGITGEEFPEKPSSNRCRWLLDPIDGTKSFVHRVPLFGTLIGLQCDDRMLLGVCRFPALDEVVYAAEGSGAWWQQGDNSPQRARVTATSDLSDALFCVTTITGWTTDRQRAAYERLQQNTRLTRGWGDCYGHMLVATGRADLMVDPEMNAWDAAALVPIVQEAGGHFLDWDGKPSIESGNGFSVNGSLRDPLLELLKP